MKIVFTHDAWAEYTSWTDRRVVRRINALIQDIERGEDGGIGKPELLRGDLNGFASRRITEERRLVYRVRGDEIEIIACYGHY